MHFRWITEFKEAQQISVILLISVLALLFKQATGTIIFGSVVIPTLVVSFAIIDFAMFRIEVKLFKREEILSKIA